jgi:hypothetical protein
VSPTINHYITVVKEELEELKSIYCLEVSFCVKKKVLYILFYLNPTFGFHQIFFKLVMLIAIENQMLSNQMITFSIICLLKIVCYSITLDVMIGTSNWIPRTGSTSGNLLLAPNAAL